MPPKTMNKAMAANAPPTQTGDQPKASCMAPQMVFAWIELLESPNCSVMSMANKTAIQRWCSPRWM